MAEWNIKCSSCRKCNRFVNQGTSYCDEPVCNYEPYECEATIITTYSPQDYYTTTSSDNKFIIEYNETYKEKR